MLDETFERMVRKADITYEEVRKAAAVFKEITGSTICRELKGSPDRPAVPCDKCVEIAAAYVENFIENHK